MNSLVPDGLAETPDWDAIPVDYFHKMLSPKSLTLAKPYLDEEWSVLLGVLSTRTSVKRSSFVAIGGGALWALSAAKRYARHYVNIEPLSDVFVHDSFANLAEQDPNISTIPKRFEDVSRKDLPEGPQIFAFWFNIMAYVENPLDCLKRILRPGDIVFISTWANNPEAHEVRRRYFEHLNGDQGEAVIDPTKTVGLCNLDEYPEDLLKTYRGYERIRGRICNILVIEV